MPVPTAKSNLKAEMRHPDLAANLRLLCSFKPSISEVGRALDLNRSQLNKYLVGAALPRPALLRRIGDYFGVEVHEILMPAADFAQLLRVRAVPREERRAALHEPIEQLLRDSDPRATALVGSYFEYYHSMSTPGSILRALMLFELHDDVVYYRRLERVGSPAAPCRRHYIYQGVALMLGERIFLTDYESTLRVELTQSVLYPDYSKKMASMLGIKVGISANRHRMPCAVRVRLERTLPGSGILANLHQCGLYAPDSDAIAPDIRDAVSNLASGPSHFQADAHG